MMERRRSRAPWLVSCAAIGAWLSFNPAMAAEDPREWLRKMNQALATRNYDGTFFHLANGRVENMRIVHRVRGGLVTERLMSLDGSDREFVRNNDELTCYLPDQHTILVEPRQDRGPFLGSLPKFDSDVNEFYRIEALGRDKVLTHPVQEIVVTPRDQFRFGYRLWLDEATAMPLKTQLCDSSGQVIEQILFARLDMPDNIPDSDLTPAVSTAGMRWVRQGASRTRHRPRCRPIAPVNCPLAFASRSPVRRLWAAQPCPPPISCIPTDWPRCPCSSRLPPNRSQERMCRGRPRMPPCKGCRGSVRVSPIRPWYRGIR